MEHWNADGSVPPRLDEYCAEVAPKWRASFETMTGRTFNEVKERTRCVAVASGLQEIVRAGCALPKCDPYVSCATCARLVGFEPPTALFVPLTPRRRASVWQVLLRVRRVVARGAGAAAPAPAGRAGVTSK